MVVGIAAAVEFLACFCASLLVHFLSWEKGEGEHLPGFFPPFLDPSLIKEYCICKIGFWLEVVVGIAAAVEFVTCFCALWYFIFYFERERREEHLLHC